MGRLITGFVGGNRDSLVFVTGNMEEEEEPEQNRPGRRKIEGETESRRDRQKWRKTGYTAAHALHQRTKQPRITNIPLVADLFFH
jgi:hypothetical protein